MNFPLFVRRSVCSLRRMVLRRKCLRCGMNGRKLYRGICGQCIDLYVRLQVLHEIDQPARKPRNVLLDGLLNDAERLGLIERDGND